MPCPVRNRTEADNPPKLPEGFEASATNADDDQDQHATSEGRTAR
jgi:hypothetical protein